MGKLNRTKAPTSPAVGEETRRKLADAAAEVLLLRDSMARAVAPLADGLHSFEMAWRELADGLADSAGPINQMAASVIELRRLAEEMGPALKRAGEVWARLPASTKRAQDLAASRGWYLGIWDHSLGEITATALMAERGDAEALEQWLENRTRRRWRGIREGVMSAFPRRAHILEQAFDAHDRSHFGVSIPAMLAQADGIHLDLLEQHLFKDNNRRKLKQRLTRRVGPGEQPSTTALAVVFLRPVLQLNALGEKPAQRRPAPDPQSPDPFRHRVMHGVDLEYATERNSLRLVALLDFLWWVKYNLRRDGREGRG